MTTINETKIECPHCLHSFSIEECKAWKPCPECGWINNLSYDPVEFDPIKIVSRDQYAEYSFQDLHVAYPPIMKDEYQLLTPSLQKEVDLCIESGKGFRDYTGDLAKVKMEYERTSKKLLALNATMKTLQFLNQS